MILKHWLKIEKNWNWKYWLKYYHPFDDKFPDDVTLKDVIIFITCVLKSDDKLYPQIFSEEVLVT